MIYILVSLILTGIATRIPLRDAPDGERKMQAVAVARTGGLAMGATVLIGMIMATVNSGASGNQIVGTLSAPSMLALFGFVLVCGVLGFVDDLRDLGPKLKTGLLAAASMIAALHLPMTRFPLPGLEGFQLPLWVAVIGTALWFFVMVNSVNFMDGANGIAFGSLAILFWPVLWVLSVFAVPSQSPGPVILASVVSLTLFAILGFLPWNIRGRIYAGDAGSLGIGAVFAVGGLVAAGLTSVWFTATLALPFVLDVVLTLIWRARRGAKLTSPHRDHAYQLFLRSGWKHWHVAMLWWGISLACAVLAHAALWADTHVEVERHQTIVTVQFSGFVVAALVGSALWWGQRRWFVSSRGPQSAPPDPTGLP